MIEQGLTALLTADTTLTGLIGGRLYPVLAPEGTAFPCITYQDVSSTSEYTLAGSEIQNKRIQFDVWATSYGQGKAVTRLLRNVLTGYSGALTDGTRILGVFRVLELDDYEPKTRTYRAINEYRFLYSEEDGTSIPVVLTPTSQAYLSRVLVPLEDFTITAAEHNKGLTPLAFFFTNQGEAVLANYTRNGAGDLLVSAYPPFTGIVQVISGAFQGISGIYLLPVPAATNTLSIPASTHNQGAYCLAFCFSDFEEPVECSYTRDSAGNLALSFGAPFTGTVQVCAGGWPGAGSLYTQPVVAQSQLSLAATKHGKGPQALAFFFTDDDPALAAAATYTRDASGNFTFAFNPPFSGLIQIVQPQ